MRTTPVPPAGTRPAVQYALRFLLASLPLLGMLLVMALAFKGDTEAAKWFDFHRNAHPELKQAMKFITYWFHRFFYAAYGIILVIGLVKKDRVKIRFSLTWLAVQLILNVAILHLLKMGIGRPRPGEGVLFHPMTTESEYHSLPSGHTSDITTSGLAAALWNRHALFALLMGCFIGLTGLSRIYLGYHYPTDVFFGWLLGATGGAAVVLLASPTRKGDA